MPSSAASPASTPALLLGAGVVDVGDPQRLAAAGSVVVADVVGDAGQGLVGERVGSGSGCAAGSPRAPGRARRRRGRAAARARRPPRAGPRRGTPRPARCWSSRAMASKRELAGSRRGPGPSCSVGPTASAPPKPAYAPQSPTMRSRRPVIAPSPVEAELGVLHLAAAVHREHRLAAGLGPLHRAAELRGPRSTTAAWSERGAGLAAEGAADVGRDDAHVVLLQPGGLGEQVARHVRVLGETQAVSASAVGSTRIALPSIGAVAMRWFTIRTPGDVRRRRRARRRRRSLAARTSRCWCRAPRTAGGRRRPSAVLHVGDGGQVVVVDVDQLGGVHRLGPGLGDDERDRVADVAHLVDGQAARGPAR